MYWILVVVAACVWIFCGFVARRIQIGLTPSSPSLVEQIGAVALGPIGVIAFLMIPRRPY